MRALIFDGELRLDDTVPVPQAAGAEALVRVDLAGICSTDLEIIRGYKGFHGVLGHEFVGTVTECADPGWTGARVCGSINIACQHCAMCRRGLPAHCERRTVLGILGKDGSFADFLTLPVENLYRVPDSLTDRVAVFVEPVAAAFQILHQTAVGPADRVAVLGDGKLGLVCAQVLRTATPHVTLVGRHERKLALARDWDLATIALADLQATPRYDVVVDATGSAAGIVAAAGQVRPRGTIVLKTTVADNVTFDLSTLVVNEVTVIGSRCGPFEPAIQALADGSVRVEALIDSEFPLRDALSAIERATQRGVLKVLLHPGG